jgi:hypothetical protein|tara:strand:+ start:120 stop:440 length:321 start_codon:yes stop_codon:yes gene_type:complete
MKHTVQGFWPFDPNRFNVSRRVDTTLLTYDVSGIMGFGPKAGSVTIARFYEGALITVLGFKQFLIDNFHYSEYMNEKNINHPQKTSIEILESKGYISPRDTRNSVT